MSYQESTFGDMEIQPRLERESQFTKEVHRIVQRGGRCLVPMFALGRAQELLLILGKMAVSMPLGWLCCCERWADVLTVWSARVAPAVCGMPSLPVLDEYWQQHPELHTVPIYYASALAKRCMAVFQTFTNMMNSRIQQQMKTSNPFKFQYISNLRVRSWSG